MTTDAYIETQIHGPVTWHDVEEVVVSDMGEDDSTNWLQVRRKLIEFRSKYGYKFMVTNKSQYIKRIQTILPSGMMGDEKREPSSGKGKSPIMRSRTRSLPSAKQDVESMPELMKNDINSLLRNVRQEFLKRLRRIPIGEKKGSPDPVIVLDTVLYSMPQDGTAKLLLDLPYTIKLDFAKKLLQGTEFKHLG